MCVRERESAPTLKPHTKKNKNKNKTLLRKADNASGKVRGISRTHRTKKEEHWPLGGELARTPHMPCIRGRPATEGSARLLRCKTQKEAFVAVTKPPGGDNGGNRVLSFLNLPGVTH